MNEQEQEFDWSAEAFAKKLAAPEEGTTEEPVSEEQPRDEKGRYGSKEPKAEPEAETEPAAEEPNEELILGKFKSTDDLIQSYKELEQRLGSQSSEVGELRKLIEERLGDDEPDDTPYIDPGSAQSVIQGFKDKSRYQEAAIYALQAGLTPAYDDVLDEWYDVEPRRAAAFERQIEMNALRAQFNNDLAPARQSVATNEFNQAWRDVAKENTDIDQFADAIMEAAQTAPEIVSALQSGDLASKKRVIENLYWMARGRRADNLAAATQQISERQAAEDTEAKIAATVTQGSATKVVEQKTRADEIREGIRLAGGTSMMDGLGKD